MPDGLGTLPLWWKVVWVGRFDLGSVFMVCWVWTWLLLILFLNSLKMDNLVCARRCSLPPLRTGFSALAADNCHYARVCAGHSPLLIPRLVLQIDSTTGKVAVRIFVRSHRCSGFLLIEHTRWFIFYVLRGCWRFDHYHHTLVPQLVRARVLDVLCSRCLGLVIVRSAAFPIPVHPLHTTLFLFFLFG